MDKHSPTPWRVVTYDGSAQCDIYDAHGTPVCTMGHFADAPEADAALIVEAVNKHEGMKLDLADERMRSDRLLQQLSNEASDAALRDKLRHEMEAYNDLRDLVRRLAEYIRHSCYDCGGPWDIDIKCSCRSDNYHDNAADLIREAREVLVEGEP